MSPDKATRVVITKYPEHISHTIRYLGRHRLGGEAVVCESCKITFRIGVGTFALDSRPQPLIEAHLKDHISRKPLNDLPMGMLYEFAKEGI